MAGTGPPPKDPAQRRRRNEPARGEWTELKDIDPKKPFLPRLPTRGAGNGRWAARTRAAWDAWRRDPATSMFGPAEIASAVDLAFLHQDWVGGEHRLAAEVRLRMDGLGLTPKGKRDLRWRVPEGAEVVQLAQARDERPRARARLRAVDAAGV